MKSNKDIAKRLRAIATYLTMDDVLFKPQAYEKAADVLETTEEEATSLYRRGGTAALEAIPGVGKSIAQKIAEYVTSGVIALEKTLRKKYPIRLDEFAGIEGLGPKTLKEFSTRLHIQTLRDLQRAMRQGKVQRLPSFGEKKSANLSRALTSAHHRSQRALLGTVLPLASKIAETLRRVESVRQLTVCGSIRRWQETIGDIDLVVDAKKSEAVMQAVTKLPQVERVLSRGSTKTSVRLHNGLTMDVRVVPPRSYGAAMQYFTGDKSHNIRLRDIAAKKGMKLNEYGLFRGTRRIAGATEKGVYRALGLAWMPPELRTNSGEIQAARHNALPVLVPYDALKGDLQVQTDWTDGSASIAEMARAAQGVGLSYIAVTDHTRDLTITHGLDEHRQQQQAKEIARVQKSMRGFTILRGAEVNIRRDGTLDLSDAALSTLDVVGVSVHSFFHLSREEMTKRILRAMEHPCADILFHPTGRLIEQREPYEVDVPAIIAQAKKHHTILEVNAFPTRLDLHDEYIRMAVRAGVKLSIDSDAHAPEHFGFLELGVGQARRGWARTRDVVNALPVERLRVLLQRGRTHRKKLNTRSVHHDER